MPVSRIKERHTQCLPLSVPKLALGRVAFLGGGTIALQRDEGFPSRASHLVPHHLEICRTTKVRHRLVTAFPGLRGHLKGHLGKKFPRHTKAVIVENGRRMGDDAVGPFIGAAAAAEI